MEPSPKREPGRLEKTIAWLVQRTVEATLPYVLPTVFVWIVSAGGAAWIWAHQRAVPLWVFLITLVPASFGLVIGVRIYLRRADFHVTADPIKSFCCEANWRDTPAAQVCITATLANGSEHPVLLLYAYLKGTTALMHFHEAISIPPRTAIQERIDFFCTKPSKAITDPYKASVVFVDAGGRKSTHRLTMMGVLQRIPTPAQSGETAKESSEV